MHKGRLEAFSDGVIAIIITIMVLELKVPHGAEPEALRELIPTFLGYVLSFVFVGIYWNNHHHLMQAVKTVNGKVLWANMFLLFWLSLIPFATNWMSESNFSTWPVAAYGILLLMAGMAYFILSRTLVAHHGQDSELAKALGADVKGLISLGLYISAIAFAFLNPLISCGIFVVVAIMWLIPDPRIENALTTK